MCNGDGKLLYYGPVENEDLYLDKDIEQSTYVDGCTLCKGTGEINEKVYNEWILSEKN